MYHLRRHRRDRTRYRYIGVVSKSMRVVWPACSSKPSPLDWPRMEQDAAPAGLPEEPHLSLRVKVGVLPPIYSASFLRVHRASTFPQRVTQPEKESLEVGVRQQLLPKGKGGNTSRASPVPIPQHGVALVDVLSLSLSLHVYTYGKRERERGRERQREREIILHTHTCISCTCTMHIHTALHIIPRWSEQITVRRRLPPTPGWE